MMKKLTKAALLAAATAFLLAGFPACEHDDDNKTPPSVEGSTDGGDTGQGDTGGDQGDDEGENPGDDKEEEETPPASKNVTYNFVGLNPNSAFVDKDGNPVAISISSKKADVPASVTKIVTSETDYVSIESAADKKFQLETTEATGGTVTSVNYNSCTLSSNKVPDSLDTATVTDFVNVLSFPVTGAGTVVVTAKVGNSTSAVDADKCVAALYDSEGKLLTKTTDILAKEGGEANLSCSVSAPTTVYIAFFRSAAKGTLKVTQIEVAQ